MQNGAITWQACRPSHFRGELSALTLAVLRFVLPRHTLRSGCLQAFSLNPYVALQMRAHYCFTDEAPILQKDSELSRSQNLGVGSSAQRARTATRGEGSDYKLRSIV